MAAAFDHWDSRAGDPQLHTHVVVQNRVQCLDGTWRTLDSRALFKHVVTLSALHQGILQDLLSARPGWGWDPHRRRHSLVPKWEVRGVGEQLMREFSRRSEQIEQAKDAAVQRFVAARGRQPSNVEMMRIRQTATLQTRPDKQHRSLAEQTARWRERARHYDGEDNVAWVAALRDRNDLPPLRADDLYDGILTDLANVAVWTVADRRATISRAAGVAWRRVRIVTQRSQCPTVALRPRNRPRTCRDRLAPLPGVLHLAGNPDLDCPAPRTRAAGQSPARLTSHACSVSERPTG